MYFRVNTSYKEIMELLFGNEVIVKAAIDSGAEFCAAYPITPATTIAETYNKITSNKKNYVYLQCEDEIAALHMVIGGSIGGKKSFTATSGPGFSLMQEGIGLAYASEVPLVIINVMRQGPSTGMPTKAAQGDILQTQYGTHGDVQNIVFYPSSLEEVYQVTVSAFNAAEISCSPVIILLDAMLSNLYETVDFRKICISDLVPHNLKFGDSNRHMTGLVSDELGKTNTDDPKCYREWKKRKNLKIRHASLNNAYYEYQSLGAKILVIAFGIVARFIDRNKKYDIFKPIRLFPICDDLVDISLRYEKIIVVEMNEGQYSLALAAYLKRNVQTLSVTYDELYYLDILGALYD